MKNKLKLGQAAGVVAFAIIIGAVSMSSSSTVDARASLKENRTVNAGVALGLTEAADATELLTAGATSALTYYGAELTVAQNDSNVVTASAQGAPQTDDASQESEQANEEAQANEAAQTPTAAQICGYTNLGMSVISSGNLNIRQEASTDSEVIGILTNHNACELLEDAGEWYKVTSGKVTGYVNKQYLVTGDEAEAIAEQEIKTVATVNTETLNVRAEKSTEAAVLSQVGNSEAFTVNSVADGWVEISVDDSVGYISQDYVTLAQALPTAKTIEQVKYGDGVSDVRASVVSYALQFVGNRYVWGGTSLEKGIDCSGFTMRILGKYGISLPHSSKAQPSYGTKISASEAKPGDLFFYGSGRSISHVAIYIGNGQIVHASNKRDGIKVSNAYYRNPICVARYLPN
ncbi:MAG: peptidoglycan endopeptidase [[Eubacterium] rectale]|nr:peptidoglycan endopeptidase [Agathobacter rectalis]